MRKLFLSSGTPMPYFRLVRLGRQTNNRSHEVARPRLFHFSAHSAFWRTGATQY